MSEVQKQRGKQVMQIIRDALMQQWDPIGVADSPEATDEYDSYIGVVYRILAGSRSEHELSEILYSIETETMGLTPVGGTLERCRDVARRLLELDLGEL